MAKQPIIVVDSPPERSLTSLELDFAAGRYHLRRPTPPAPEGSGWSLEAMTAVGPTLFFSWVRTH
jgi:hypothetical protein